MKTQQRLIYQLAPMERGLLSVRLILQQKSPESSQLRWTPDFVVVSGIYCISALSGDFSNSDASKNKASREGHLVLLDRGNIGALPLEDGKVAWTIHHS